MENGELALNFMFNVAAEMIPGHGEDSYYSDCRDNEFVVCAFDGCGGAGSKKYANLSGRTGAYIASRAICGSVMAWYESSGEISELRNYVDRALDICRKAGGTSGRLMGSLGKAFPTTAAILRGCAARNHLKTECCWAGDSRCYILDMNGLHQLTEDDIDGQDAMSNLRSDGVMTNVINASTNFELHTKHLLFDHPCVLLSATDGCFGYLESPMEFEYLLVDSLERAVSPEMWINNLHERFKEVSGDDYTLSVAVCGFNSFDNLKRYMSERRDYVYGRYINTGADSDILWTEYKQEYSAYLK